MGKFTSLQNDVFAIFGTTAWVAESIKTVPTNMFDDTNNDSFIRINIIASGSGVNVLSVSGVLIIDIFTPINVGPNPVSLIADKLDDYLLGKTFTADSKSVTQFASSSLSFVGQDADNAMLFRSKYQVNLNFFRNQ